MGWAVALFLGAILCVLAGRYRTFLRHWEHLRAIISDLADEREPANFVFLNGGRFAAIGAILERVADTHERLRRRRTQQERNLQTILTSMEEAVMVVDHRHTIRLVNPSFLRLFELRLDPLTQSLLEVLRNSQLDEIVKAAFTTSQPQQRSVSVEHLATPRHLSVFASPMRDATGNDAVVMIFHDVTRLRQLEEVRREFVANVSHELRTPLSILQGYLENLTDNPDLPRSERNEALEIMTKHSLRLNALLEDLLILARLEARADQLQIEEIPLPEFISEVVSHWKKRSEETGVTLRTDVPADLPVLHADSFRLEQVFNNLIDNALKYSDPSGVVIIRARASETGIEIRVEDRGAGIPPADLPHVFERFYRADKARSRLHGGTGLGLSIVKHIAERHGGTVAAESAHGAGTTIILRFPREPVLLSGRAELEGAE
ncbi:MAG TPA: ATP-binding protein [Chthoniobacteraceae bacterium]|nr:ATP-binding protein [Chthoniobacteraceae bacterium]